jgi:hypothetical protein
VTNTPEDIAAAVQQLAAAGACGYSLLTGQPCPIHDNGVPAQATITVKPQAADPELLTIEVDSQGIPPAAVAHALRQAAERLDIETRAAEDEPIPYRLTEQAEQPDTPWITELRKALKFNARAVSHPTVITLRDALLDCTPRNADQALEAACILLAAHTRELSARADDYITAHRAADPKGRSVRALRTGMASIRGLLDEHARTLDPQAQR